MTSTTLGTGPTSAPEIGWRFGESLDSSKAPIREVLRDGEIALLVNYGDVDGLAGALTRLIRDPKERERVVLAVAAANGA
jgi:hypothetical protein